MIRITPRLVPVRFESRTPVGLKGRIHLAKVARDGRRVPVRVDRSKRAFQRVWDHVQDNLITNGGLDHGLSGTSNIPTANAAFTPLRFNRLTHYVAVGTDNTTPATSDSALGAEVARTNQTLSMGVDEEVTLPSDGVGLFRRVRAFDYAEANGNLAEFGGGADDTTTVLTRGLFEDEGGNPTPITKTNEELLVVTYDLISNVSPITVTAAGTLTVTGYDTFDISSMVHVGMAGNPTNTHGLWRSVPRIFPLTQSLDQYAATNIASGVMPVGVPFQGLGGAEDYVGGSYERVVTGTYGPQASGATLAGFAVGTAFLVSGNAPLASFRFDNPSTLDKDKDYRVTLSARIAVSRS